VNISLLPEAESPNQVGTSEDQVEKMAKLSSEQEILKLMGPLLLALEQMSKTTVSPGKHN